MKMFLPPGRPALEPPPAKKDWNHSERVLVYYEASPELNLGEAWGIAYYHYNPPYEDPHWVDFANQREPSLWWPLPEQHDHTCHCGGQVASGGHVTGVPGCLRTMTVAPVRVSLSDDTWSVDGHVITGFTLLQQRGYHQHPCGCYSWSGCSSNSLDPDD